MSYFVTGKVRITNTAFIAASAIFCILTFHPPLFGEHAEGLKGAEVVIATAAGGQERFAGAANSRWPRIETKHFTVYYDPEVNLKAVNRDLDTRNFYINGASRSAEPMTIEDKIAYRIDNLFSRAREVLDMWPACRRLNILIYRTRSELNAEYFRLFNTEEDYKSFYIHQLRTIYISEEDMSDSIIAHEMGHAIVDHYFSVIPPPKIAELLASYVDLHLDD